MFRRLCIFGVLLAAWAAVCVPTPAVAQQQEPAQPPIAVDVNDQAIEERLNAVFEHVDELRNVTAEVESGVVHLTGEVEAPEAGRRAAELAGRLEGVVYVDNDIEAAQEVSRRLAPAVDKLVEVVDATIVYLPIVLVSLLILLVFWLVGRAVSRFDFLYRRLSDRPLIQNIVRQMAGSVVVITGVILVLEVFDITALVGAVLGTAGVAGIALGFAFRDIGENYLASIVLGMRRPFRQNDWVLIGEEVEGKIIRLTTRDTVLMTLDGNHVRVPNSVVFKSVIHNFTLNPRRRFGVEVGVGVDEDLVDVRRIGIEALDDMHGVLDDPRPFARVERLGDSNVQLTFFGWVDQAQYDFLNVNSEATHVVKAALDAAGVLLPEPIYRVNLRNLEQADKPEARPERPRPAEPAPPSVVNLEAEAEIDDQIAEERKHTDESDLLEE